MARSKELLAKIEAEGAQTYEDLSDALKTELRESGYAPPEIVHQGLVGLKAWLEAF